MPSILLYITIQDSQIVNISSQIPPLSLHWFLISWLSKLKSHNLNCLFSSDLFFPWPPNLGIYLVALCLTTMPKYDFPSYQLCMHANNESCIFKIKSIMALLIFYSKLLHMTSIRNLVMYAKWCTVKFLCSLIGYWLTNQVVLETLTD